MQCLPHVFRGGRGHLIAATCWDLMTLPGLCGQPVQRDPAHLLYNFTQDGVRQSIGDKKKRTVPIRVSTVARAQRGFPLIRPTC